MMSYFKNRLYVEKLNIFLNKLLFNPLLGITFKLFRFCRRCHKIIKLQKLLALAVVILACTVVGVDAYTFNFNLCL